MMKQISRMIKLTKENEEAKLEIDKFMPTIVESYIAKRNMMKWKKF